MTSQTGINEKYVHLLVVVVDALFCFAIFTVSDCAVAMNIDTGKCRESEMWSPYFFVASSSVEQSV